MRTQRGGELSSAQKAEPMVSGLAVIDSGGKLLYANGDAADPRIRTMLTDRPWRGEAIERRLIPINLTNGSYVALVVELPDGATIALIFPGVHGTVVRFLAGVDFAFDIIDHVLSDPYDAMAIVDADGKLVFVSPIHEKFFGLQPSEGVGKNVNDIIENTRLPHVVRTGVAEVGQLQKMRGRERVVSRHPIRRNGKIVGAIGRVMFKGPQQLEALSKRVNALEQQIANYQNEAKEAARGEEFLDAIIGQSPAIHAVREHIRKIAPLDIPVLIQGESGTGKELVAQALHMMSPRREARLVTVNAAALPIQLVESELFGYEAGSFTGADRKGRAGKFEQADNGTIFLDEIGDMALDVQSKLLRVLQDRIIERVGGDKPRKSDFRLVSATNKDLEYFVEQGKFRLDLYYRISPTIIELPSLAERVEDIPLLLNHFLADMARHYKREVPEVDSNLLEYLMDRPWPGNIREFRHSIERAFVLSENNRLGISSFQMSGGNGSAVSHMEMKSTEQVSHGNLKEKLEQVEREMISDTLLRFNGNKKKVAEHLGISRTYLYKKLGA